LTPPAVVARARHTACRMPLGTQLLNRLTRSSCASVRDHHQPGFWLAWLSALRAAILVVFSAVSTASKPPGNGSSSTRYVSDDDASSVRRTSTRSPTWIEPSGEPSGARYSRATE